MPHFWHSVLYVVHKWLRSVSLGHICTWRSTAYKLLCYHTQASLQGNNKCSFRIDEGRYGKARVNYSMHYEWSRWMTWRFNSIMRWHSGSLWGVKGHLVTTVRQRRQLKTDKDGELKAIRWIFCSPTQSLSTQSSCCPYNPAITGPDCLPWLLLPHSFLFFLPKGSPESQNPLFSPFAFSQPHRCWASLKICHSLGFSPRKKYSF